MARYIAEDSSGLACRYLPVVATEACPRVAFTRWVLGAPLEDVGGVCVPHPVGETSPFTPALLAAAFTIRSAWMAVMALLVPS